MCHLSACPVCFQNLHDQELTLINQLFCIMKHMQYSLKVDIFMQIYHAAGVTNSKIVRGLYIYSYMAVF